MNNQRYTALLNGLRQIARDAGAAILDIYNHPDNFQVEHKADDSPLTAADRAANTIICKGLEQLPELFPIISEENKAVPYATRREYAYYWLVDPLDGTKEFIKRNGEFTVNIALVHQQRVVMGVVYAPVLDELYWAAEGMGAFVVRQQGEPQPLHAPQYTRQDTGLKVVCSRSHLNDSTKAFVEALNAPDLVATGSSLKFLLIAAGQAHLYPRLAPTMEWDTAAAQIILEEAGGTVVHHDTGEPLRYNKEDLLNPFFVAAGAEQAEA